MITIPAKMNFSYMEVSTVYQILERRVPSYLLEGYVDGILNEELDKLYAYTFKKLTPEDHDIASSLRSSFPNSSGAWGLDEVKSRNKPDEEGCFTMKDHQQCIREGLYYAYSVSFYGYFYDGWWYILKQLSYYGEHMSEAAAHQLLSENDNLSAAFNHSLFEPMEAYYPTWGTRVEKLHRGSEYQEFIGIPELVAYLKQEQKAAVCRAFVHFMNQDMFLPFVERLKVARFDEFSGVLPLYSDEFIMIFPNTREHLLIPALVRGVHNEYRLYYFYWDTERKIMYNWTYFIPKSFRFSHAYTETIMDNLSQISHWKEATYLNSSCTMDDHAFWNDYVLPKDEQGAYKYLTELPY